MRVGGASGLNASTAAAMCEAEMVSVSEKVASSAIM